MFVGLYFFAISRICMSCVELSKCCLTTVPDAVNRQSYTVDINLFPVNLTFLGPCIANIFSEYNQQDATFLNLSISVRRSTCFRWFFLPSSGARNCTYSVRHLSDHYWYLLLAAGSILHLTEINKLRKVASCRLYSENLFPILISSWVMFIYSSNVCQKQCSQIRDIIIYWLNIYVHQKAPVQYYSPQHLR